MSNLTTWIAFCCIICFWKQFQWLHFLLRLFVIRFFLNLFIVDCVIIDCKHEMFRGRFPICSFTRSISSKTSNIYSHTNQIRTKIGFISVKLHTKLYNIRFTFHFQVFIWDPRTFPIMTCIYNTYTCTLHRINEKIGCLTLACVTECLSLLISFSRNQK